MKNFALAVLFASAACGAASAQVMLVGIDTKVVFDDQGKRVNQAPGRDLVQAYDLRDPAHPQLTGEIELSNSVIGPPTNLAVTPDGRIGLVSSALRWEPAAAGGWNPVMDDRLFIVDLQARPLKLLTTLQVGKQPSGLAIAPGGRLALLANRGGHSVSVLSIDAGNVQVIDTIDMGDEVTSVAITPDGRRALVDKFLAHKVAFLSIDGNRVAPTHYEVPAGLYPYQVAVSRDGRWGLAGDTGQAYSNGNADPVTVIDLQATPPRVVDYVTAGDSVEGLAVSPRGDYAIAAILNGSYDTALNSWFRHSHGRAVLLGLQGEHVTREDSIEVGAYPEGVAFSPNGSYAYTGNFAGRSISVLRVTDDGHLLDTHQDVKLPGPAASLRVGSQ